MSQQRQYLNAMGIDVWIRREMPQTGQMQAEEQVEHGQPEKVIDQPALSPVPVDDASVDWQNLQARVSNCTACELHKSRTQTVFGVGNRQADWLIIGEAPGADEDRQGEPFVGKAGQLLNKMLIAIGLQREQVYIANILKCRPPKNRDPRPEEAAECEHFLKAQIDLIRPDIILVVGRIAAQNLLKTDTSIGKMRGRVYHYGESRIPVVVTYHPAYLLRAPHEKKKSWNDLKFALKLYKEIRQIDDN